MNWKAIEKAYDLVKSGLVKRVDIEDDNKSIRLYQLGDTVRIDIKGVV